MPRPLVLAAAALAGVLALPASAAAQEDLGRRVFNILPPGQSGSVPPDANSTDQLTMYDGLTPLFGNVTDPDISKFFKSARFGVEGPVTRTETPRPGVTIQRDSFNVPHITGQTRDDVTFGAGWATAEDRGLFIEVIRGPARVAALDVPGLDAFALGTSLRQFEPSAATERFLDEEIARVSRELGARGTQMLRDLDAYVAGINAYYRSTGNTAKPWTRRDVVAASSLIGGVFGQGGGGEANNAAFLANLQRRLGPAAGLRVFNDFRERQDPETPTSIPNRFAYDLGPRAPTAGSPVIDAGSFQGTPAASVSAAGPRRLMSNVQLVSARRSATGRPLAVMGPQVGYFYPQFLMEMDLHGGGIDARGAAFPGVSLYVLVGRGKGFAWSATSASSDNRDEFLEELCNANGSRPTRRSTSYRYRGRCIPLTTFDAGVLKAGGGQPDQRVRFRESVHGPVTGTVMVRGRPYAVARARTTRGRDVASAAAFVDLNTNQVSSARDFARVMNQVEFTFNWFYVDGRDIAMFSSGRLPIRAPGTNADLPTLGTGQYDWRGFLPRSRHPQAVNPGDGILVNWNNKPAPGWAAADDNFSYGSVHRDDLLKGFKARNDLADVVSVMNRAATQDLRAVEVWPTIARVLTTGAPDARTRQAAALVSAWSRNGGSRLDRDLDGRVDDPGAAILDAAFQPMAVAIVRPVLGPLLGTTSETAAPPPGTLQSIISRSVDPHESAGNSYGSGWYGYVDKDLRTLLGDRVRGRFSRVYCGRGNLAACRRSLWAALKSAVDRLARRQGSDPTRWRADARRERIVFEPGLLGAANTMRWANRPTFQQVVEFNAP